VPMFLGSFTTFLLFREDDTKGFSLEELSNEKQESCVEGEHSPVIASQMSR